VSPDEVDRIVAAWQRQRPDLDVSPLQVLSRVTRLGRHLDRARSTAFGALGLELWEFDVLAALRRAGEPYQLTVGRLVAQTLVSSGTMTNRIDRLAGRDLVGRHPDPSDGRGVIVRITPAGGDLVDVALAALLAKEHELLHGLDPVQRDQLAGLLRMLLAPFDAPG
jgi:DNA-binding MarR family transcriptional regulator